MFQKGSSTLAYFVVHEHTENSTLQSLTFISTSSSGNFYFQQTTTMKQEQTHVVDISKCTDTLLHCVDSLRPSDAYMRR